MIDVRESAPGVLRCAISALIASVGLSGCMTTDFTKMRDRVSDRAKGAVADIANPRGPGGLSEIESEDQPANLMADRVERADDTPEIVINGVARLGDILKTLAQPAGYSVMYAEGVEVQREVAASITTRSAIEAIRRIATVAGYAAVVDPASKTITIAEQAVYSFKLPAHLLQAMPITMSVGGNPVSTGGSSGSGSGSAPGSSIKAEFTAEAKIGNNVSTLIAYIQQLGGANASVSVAPDMGLITVRSNGVALSRVRDFLNRLSTTSMRRIEIRASIIEVGVGETFQYGIDWSRILGNGSYVISTSGSAASVPNPGMNINVVRSGITGVIRALRTQTDVKIITQPTITAMNRMPAVLFDGVQLPYLGSVTATQTQNSTSTSGSTSFAVDGISLSIHPDIISESEAHLTIVPVLSTVTDFKTFELAGGGKLTAPVQSNKQSLMNVQVQNGRTVILGGIRYSNENRSRDGILPGVLGAIGPRGDLGSNHREIVILLQANIIPASKYEVLFTESL